MKKKRLLAFTNKEKKNRKNTVCKNVPRTNHIWLQKYLVYYSFLPAYIFYIFSIHLKFTVNFKSLPKEYLHKVEHIIKHCNPYSNLNRGYSLLIFTSKCLWYYFIIIKIIFNIIIILERYHIICITDIN